MKCLHWKVLMIAICLQGTALNGFSEAQEGRFDIGFRLNGLGGSGKPTNDILGFGIQGRYRLNGRWWVGFGVDQSDEFDVERPAEFLGLPVDFSDDEIDAKGTSTVLMGWIERVYERGGRLEWFWTAGAGLNSVDIDPVEGPRTDGGIYRIVTDTGDEVILSLSAGLRWRFGQRWTIEVAARGDQHFADWDLVDEVSRASTTIDDYFIRGVTLGLRYRF